MAVTIDDLAQDWRRARDALTDQLRLISEDPIFPAAGQSDADRRAMVQELELLVARYDNLLMPMSSAACRSAVPSRERFL